MEERIRPTRAGLFFIELMIAVGIFSLCAAICIGLFVNSEQTSRSDADLVRANIIARDVAESFKASHGDLSETMGVTGGSIEGDALQIWYDGDWQQTGADGAVFGLSLQPVEQDGYSQAALRVWVNGEEDPLLNWRVASLL